MFQPMAVTEPNQQHPLPPVKLFCCYAHTDKAFRAELEKHLGLLKRLGVIHAWHDRKIPAGQAWAGPLDPHLETAEVLLLLVSPDFIAADFCYGREMARALVRHEQGLTMVVPVLLRPTDLADTPLLALPCLPLGLKPISLWLDKEQAYLDVTKGLRQLLGEWHERPKTLAQQAKRGQAQDQAGAISADGQQLDKPAPKAVVAPADPLSLKPHRPVGGGLNAKGLPDMVWRQIPKGTVVLADNAGKFQVQPFYLARYPITNAQFQSFLDAKDGYPNPRWWAGLDAVAQTPEPPCWPEANHPCERVSWFEAMAFCAWLSRQLGYTVSLPTEWQWQQAACGGQAGYVYPWGKKYQLGYANIDETWGNVGHHYWARTSAVGSYPQGDSAQGVADLIGNVWEWCLNAYNPADKTSVSGAFSRVLRGGSWYNGWDSARASYRFCLAPANRNNTIGFRVCCLNPH